MHTPLRMGGFALVALLSAWQPAHAATEILLGQPAKGARPLSPRDHQRVAGRLYMVVDTPYESWSGLGTYVHVACYGPDFTPAAGARIYANEQLIGTTDANGTLVFRRKPARGGNEEDQPDPGVLLTGIYEKGDKRYLGRVSYQSYARTPSFASTELFVYTDRGVYQPVDTIRARSIASKLRGDFEPLADQAVELHLLTEHGRLLAAGKAATSSYGTASFDFPLPRSTPEGRYTLVVISGKSRESTRLRVERIRPPALDIQHTLPRFVSADQQALPFEVRLTSFVGPPPRGGRLHVSVQHKGRRYHEQAVAIDGRDAYQLELPASVLAALKESALEESFEVTLTATDENNRGDALTRDMRLTSFPYLAVLETDKDFYALVETAKVQVKLNDLDGVPVRNKPVRLRIMEQPSAPRTTDGSGVVVFDVLLHHETTAIEVWVDDVARPLAEHTLHADASKPLLSKVAAPVVVSGATVPIRVDFAPGYVPTERHVHGDVVDSSGALVSAFLLPVSKRGDHYAAEGTLRAPAWGTMLLTLFCAARFENQNAGLLTEGQQITVQPNKELRITLSGVPATARPGDEVLIKGRVLGSGNKAVSAAVGAAVVDAALLSLLDPLEITPQDRFYNPELKVMATTGSKILTWPVVSRNWGPNQYDIALPPFGFSEGESIEEQQVAERDAREEAEALGATAFGDDHLGGMLGVGGGYGVGAGLGAGGGGIARTGSVSIAGSATAPVITIRTNFAETALWLPELEAQGGAFSFRARLPDSITQQTLTLVASDKQGGVGLAKHNITVQEELFVRSDLPVALQLDQPVSVNVAVRNLGTRAHTGKVSLSASGLQVTTPPQELTVQPGQTAVASFWVRPTAIGSVPYEIAFASGKLRDVERRTVQVKSSASRREQRVTGKATRDQPFAAHVTGDHDTTARLGVTFNGSARVVQDYLRLLPNALQDRYAFWEEPGAQATMAYHLAVLLQRHGALTADMAYRLRDAIVLDLVRLGINADATGGYRFFRTGQVSPYLTGRALEAMTSARASEVPIPIDVMTAAATTILKAVDARGEVSTRDIAWWEGEQHDRRLALSAELFRIVCEAGPEVVSSDMRAAFDRLRERVLALPNVTNDALTLAQVGLALLAYHDQWLKTQVDAKVARRLVRRLLELRRGAHWEPSWFNGAGGSLVTTAAVLEMLHIYDPAAAAPIVRELSAVLESARASLGRWHFGSANAALVRALSVLPVEQPEPQRFSVQVRVNGSEVLSQKIDPADPFGSAATLAHVDLTPHLRPGSNEVQVITSGVSAPFVDLEIESDGPAPAEASLGRSLSEAQARVGSDIAVQVKLPAAQGPVALHERLPPLVTVVESSLQELVTAGKLFAYELGDELVLYPRPDVRELIYTVRAVRTGQGVFTPSLLRPLHHPERSAWGAAGQPLEITPGP